MAEKKQPDAFEKLQQAIADNPGFWFTGTVFEFREAIRNVPGSYWVQAMVGEKDPRGTKGGDDD